MKSGEDAVAVLKSHFETVFSGGGGEGGLESNCNRVDTDKSMPESSERFCEQISREEISWAINVRSEKGCILRRGFCCDGHDGVREAV